MTKTNLGDAPDTLRCVHCASAIGPRGGLSDPLTGFVCTSCIEKLDGYYGPRQHELDAFLDDGRGRTSVRSCPVYVGKSSITVYHDFTVRRHGAA